jgi:hypothetical protein
MTLYSADLITRVREKIDESNTETVSDAFILRSLNEAQRTLVRTVARQYDQIFIDNTDLTTDGTAFLTIPEDAYDRRVEFIEMNDGTAWKRLQKVKPGRITPFRLNTNNKWPVAYTTKQNKIQLLPTPTSGLTVKVWYTKRPGELVSSYGRIVDYDTGAGTITLDSLSSSVSTDVDNLAAFINVIDGTTGLVKGSYQVASADTDTDIVTIKSSGLDRSTVAGKTISTSLSTDIEKDDYICSIGGTCVLELLADYSDYLIQYAVVGVRRSLREDTSADYAYLKDLERELETIWAGREQENKVTSKNPHWVTYRRR